MPIRTAIVRGSVQGVGFRAFVVELAHRLGVEGEVWNRRDGAVEVTFEQDDESVLARFAAELWSGPGCVDEVELQEIQGDLAWPGFRIGPSR